MLTDRYLNGIPKDSRVNTDGRFLHADQFDEKRMIQIGRSNAFISSCRDMMTLHESFSPLPDGGVICDPPAKPEE